MWNSKRRKFCIRNPEEFLNHEEQQRKTDEKKALALCLRTGVIDVKKGETLKYMQLGTLARYKQHPMETRQLYSQYTKLTRCKELCAHTHSPHNICARSCLVFTSLIEAGWSVTFRRQVKGCSRVPQMEYAAPEGRCRMKKMKSEGFPSLFWNTW